MLTLKDFVKETLTQISEAVADHEKTSSNPLLANRDAGDVNPKGDTFLQHGFINFGTKNDRRIYATVIDFDIAVTTEEKTDAGAGASIKVAGIFSADAGANAASNNASISRVKFKLPFTVY